MFNRESNNTQLTVTIITEAANTNQYQALNSLKEWAKEFKKQQGEKDAGLDKMVNDWLVTSFKEGLDNTYENNFDDETYKNMFVSVNEFIAFPSAETARLFINEWSEIEDGLELYEEEEEEDQVLLENSMASKVNHVYEEKEEKTGSKTSVYEMKDNQDELPELKQLNSKLRAEISRLGKAMKTQLESIKSLEINIDAKDSKIAALEKEITKLDQKVASVERVREQLGEAEKLAQTRANNIASLESALTQEKTKNEKLEREKKELNSQVEKQRTENTSESKRVKSISKDSHPKLSANITTTAKTVGSLRDAKQKVTDLRDAQIADLQTQLRQSKSRAEQAESQLAIVSIQPGEQLRQAQSENEHLTSRVEQLSLQLKQDQERNAGEIRSLKQRAEQVESKLAVANQPQHDSETIEAKKCKVYDLLHNILNDNVAFWAQQQSQIPMRGVEVKRDRGTTRVPTGIGNMINLLNTVDTLKDDKGGIPTVTKMTALRTLQQEAENRAKITGIFGRKQRVGRTGATAEFYNLLKEINLANLNNEKHLDELIKSLELKRDSTFSVKSKSPGKSA